MLGQLFMRIVKAPKWWTDSDGGLLLKDENIIGELYRMMELKVKERETGVVYEGKDAIKKLEKSAKKIVRAEEGADAQE
jgi:TolB-like protein